LTAARTWHREFRRVAEDYDIVHAVDPRGLVLAKAGSGQMKPVVWHVHYSTTRNRGEWAVNRLLRRLPNACAVPSAAGAALIPGLDGLVAEVVPNMPVRRWPCEPSPIPTVVTLARFFPSKGIETAIEAALLMRRDRPNFRWLVVGGPQPGYEAYAANLAGRIHSAGLGSTVQLLSHTARPETLLRRAWVYAQPSHTEMLPISTLEAAANGLPVVASAVGGLTDIVIDGATGALVDPGDAAQLAQALLMLFDDEARRGELARAGQEHVARKFGRPAFAAALERLYDRVSSE
jgi:glycosyltransferase involved in cell wall biosynthesis